MFSLCSKSLDVGSGLAHLFRWLRCVHRRIFRHAARVPVGNAPCRPQSVARSRHRRAYDSVHSASRAPSEHGSRNSSVVAARVPDFLEVRSPIFIMVAVLCQIGPRGLLDTLPGKRQIVGMPDPRPREIFLDGRVHIECPRLMSDEELAVILETFVQQVQARPRKESVNRVASTKQTA
jgi:hypothetical protein